MKKIIIISEKIYTKLDGFISTKIALILLFIWSFFEASIWFIAPDFLIAIYLAINNKKIKNIILVSSFASIIGGIAYYVISLNFYDPMTSLLFNTPFTSLKNIETVKSIFESYGVFGTLLQSVTLIPFKIWTNLAIINEFNPFAYFSFVTISRIFRFGLTGVIASYVGRKYKDLIKKYFLLILSIFIILFFTLMFFLEA